MSVSNRDRVTHFKAPMQRSSPEMAEFVCDGTFQSDSDSTYSGISELKMPRVSKSNSVKLAQTDVKSSLVAKSQSSLKLIMKVLTVTSSNDTTKLWILPLEKQSI